MPPIDTIPHGVPCWFDLVTHDHEAAMRFYDDTFGNAITEQDMGDEGPTYATITVDGEDDAGLMTVDDFLPE